MSAPEPRESTHSRSRPYDGAVAGFSRLDVAGYILAFVLPLFGLIVGVMLIRRPEKQTARHGMWIIAISLVVGVLFAAALIAAAHGLGASETE
jgi:uncharacterized membrane protein